MDYLIIYKYSLCVALTLILFFGFYFLTAPTPEKPIFDNYLGIVAKCFESLQLIDC